jgi:hypothetical protein
MDAFNPEVRAFCVPSLHPRNRDRRRREGGVAASILLVAAGLRLRILERLPDKKWSLIKQ